MSPTPSRTGRLSDPFEAARVISLCLRAPGFNLCGFRHTRHSLGWCQRNGLDQTTDFNTAGSLVPGCHPLFQRCIAALAPLHLLCRHPISDGDQCRIAGANLYRLVR